MMNIEKTVGNIPPQSEYIKIDKLKSKILSDPIYSKCPVCGKATMSRALEHAFEEWKKEYGKKVKVEVIK